MAIDRDETLRKAEKLLRQGNLPGAIAEYVRVVDEFPADANTLNKLAELYQRSGQVPQAVTTYMRAADLWLREGLYGKAAAHYKRVLKLKPNDEAALLQLVQASIRQGSLVEAKGYLRIARDAREARGDRPGADQLTLQLADLDPSDFDAKLKGIRVRLAQEPSRSMVSEVRAAIAELERAGRGHEAEDLLAGLIKLDPDNIDARVQVVEAAMRRGDDDAARAALPANPEESHRPEVVVLAAELELKAGRVDGARPLLQRLLTLDRSRGRVTIRELGERLRAVDLGIAYACVEAVVDDQTSVREFVDASEALKRFVKLSPRHVPALLRLVEVAVDGDLEKDVTLAQRQLADAYLHEGEALKARVIAEDLLSRDPRSLSERKRLHRALVALGEDDPDAIITDLLSDQLGLGDDLTPIDDTEDDEAAQAELAEASETESDADATPETHDPPGTHEAAGTHEASAAHEAHEGHQAPGTHHSPATDDAYGTHGAQESHETHEALGTHEASEAFASPALDGADAAAYTGQPDADEAALADAQAQALATAHTQAGAVAEGDAGLPSADARHPEGDGSSGDGSGAHGYLGAVRGATGPFGDRADAAEASAAAPMVSFGGGGGTHKNPHEDPHEDPLSGAAPSGPFVSPEAFGAPEAFAAPDPLALTAPDTFDAIEPFGAVEPPPSDALFPAGVDEPDLPDLGAVASAAGTHPVPPPAVLRHVSESGVWPAPESDCGIAFEPEPVDFLPTDHDLPTPASLGALQEPPAPNLVSPDVPLATTRSSSAAGQDDDAEIDLTGALNALAKNGVSISEALDAVMPPSPGTAIPSGSSEKFGGLPASAEAFAPGGAAGKDRSSRAGAGGGSGGGAGAGHANGSGSGSGSASASGSTGAGRGQAGQAGQAGDDDLERVFDGLRSQAAGDMVEMSQPDQSVRLLSMAETYQSAGMYDEARAALEQVASDSRYRFRAASALGRLFWQQGDADASLRWMELASEAPAPDREAGRALMYELGEKLEQTGETTRALAVFLELLGEQEDYRDVRQRVDRLSRVQAES